jgi:hypoxanthine phosphoribosyltransferase
MGLRRISSRLDRRARLGLRGRSKFLGPAQGSEVSILIATGLSRALTHEVVHLSTKAVPSDVRVVVSAQEIQKRVGELARQIANDYRGKTVHAVCVMENGFVFMADLVRALELPVVCHFVRPVSREIGLGASSATEIFFSPEPDVSGADVLLIEALVQTGLTTEFLMRNLYGRGAASVKLVALLDRHAARTVAVPLDYVGFPIDQAFVFGYGLGDPHSGRNLPYIAAARTSAAAGSEP